MSGSAPALVAEAIGTFLFFFIAAGAALVATGDPAATLLIVALAHGVVLAVLVSSFGAVSGGHFNPAVTLGLWIAGQIDAVKGLAYMVAQLVGGAAAGFALAYFFGDVGPAVPALGEGVDVTEGILLEAIARARAELPDVMLELAGEGPLEPELRAAVARLELGGAVTFLGHVAPPTPVYERAEIVVVPSFGEGFGMVALEAMERGRAVIASDVGGLPEIVAAGETGLIVPPGDASGLAAAIVELAGDPARAAALGAAGRARALAEFSQERCTARTEELYLAALETGARRRSRTSTHARSSANAASSASRKSQGAR